MTKRTSKASSKQVHAAAWSSIWTSYAAAVRSGDVEAISAAKAAVRAWHDQSGAAIPSWAW
jgi:hypothetical protein